MDKLTLLELELSARRRRLTEYLRVPLREAWAWRDAQGRGHVVLERSIPVVAAATSEARGVGAGDARRSVASATSEAAGNGLDRCRGVGVARRLGTWARRSGAIDPGGGGGELDCGGGGFRSGVGGELDGGGRDLGGDGDVRCVGGDGLIDGDWGKLLEEFAQRVVGADGSFFFFEIVADDSLVSSAVLRTVFNIFSVKHLRTLDRRMRALDG